MKKIFVLVLLMGIISGAANALPAQSVKDVTGEWAYEVPTAPYGYQKGVITIAEKEGVLSGEVKFDSGYKIQLKSVSYEAATLKLGLYVDYEYVTVTAKVAGKKMEGTVDSSQGKMALKAGKK